MYLRIAIDLFLIIVLVGVLILSQSCAPTYEEHCWSVPELNMPDRCEWVPE